MPMEFYPSQKRADSFLHAARFRDLFRGRFAGDETGDLSAQRHSSNYLALGEKAVAGNDHLVISFLLAFFHLI
jgi:hypothetical protein